MKEHRLRFNTHQDVRLLELARELNPYANGNWDMLHKIFVNEFNKPHSLRSCKEHLDRLLRQHVNGSSKGEPPVPEYFNLIEQVIELRKNSCYVKETRNRRKKSPEQNQLFVEISDGSQSVSSSTAASNNDKKLSLHLLSCTDPDTCDCKDKLQWDVEVANQGQGGSNYSFNFISQNELAEYSNNTNSFMNSEKNHPEISDSTVLAYLKSKFSDEKDTKEKELALEERKLALREEELKLQKEKFELEKLERSKRLEIELKERELHMRVIEQQQNLINMYMKNNPFRI